MPESVAQTLRLCNIPWTWRSRSLTISDPGLSRCRSCWLISLEFATRTHTTTHTSQGSLAASLSSDPYSSTQTLSLASRSFIVLPVVNLTWSWLVHQTHKMQTFSHQKYLGLTNYYFNKQIGKIVVIRYRSQPEKLSEQQVACMQPTLFILPLLHFHVPVVLPDSLFCFSALPNKKPSCNYFFPIGPSFAIYVHKCYCYLFNLNIKW